MRKKSKPSLIFISGNSNRVLAEELARTFGCKLGKSEVTKFADGEISVVVKDNIYNSTVIVVQSITKDPNVNLMELFVLVDAIKRLKPKATLVVMPYFGYSRADRAAIKGEAVSAELVANLMKAAHIDKIITVDIHSDRVINFLKNNKIQLANISVMPLFIDYIKSSNIKDLVVVSPDKGGAKRAKYAADKLNAHLIQLTKSRPSCNKVVFENFKAKVKDKNIIIFDDIIDTGGTIVNISKLLKKQGCKDMFIFATHGLFSGDAIERINNSSISKVYITNTVFLEKEKLKSNKIKIIDIESFITDSMKSIIR